MPIFTIKFILNFFLPPFYVVLLPVMLPALVLELDIMFFFVIKKNSGLFVNHVLLKLTKTKNAIN